jgi:hypothetical protein
MGGTGALRISAPWEITTAHAPPALAEETPDWWAYAAQYPRWHVWRGVAGLLYARRPRTSPPWIVRATDPDELAQKVALRERGQRPCW